METTCSSWLNPHVLLRSSTTLRETILFHAIQKFLRSWPLGVRFSCGSTGCRPGCLLCFLLMAVRRPVSSQSTSKAAGSGFESLAGHLTGSRSFPSGGLTNNWQYQNTRPTWLGLNRGLGSPGTVVRCPPSGASPSRTRPPPSLPQMQGRDAQPGRPAESEPVQRVCQAESDQGCYLEQVNGD